MKDLYTNCLISNTIFIINNFNRHTMGGKNCKILSQEERKYYREGNIFNTRRKPPITKNNLVSNVKPKYEPNYQTKEMAPYFLDCDDDDLSVYRLDFDTCQVCRCCCCCCK